ncbi:MAG TPA: trehalose-phosphatase, partial [Myxococcota bacterium]|nr:trehalose-phosphatase [Myxococcota bacterium]
LGQGFAAAPHAVLALDYDGTLADLTPVPDAARPSEELRGLLRGLGSLSGVEVVVISGRPHETLEAWLGDLPVHLVGEHGYFYRRRGGTTWEAALPHVDLAWREPVHRLMEESKARTRGAWIESKPVSLVWHYRKAEPGFGAWMARELEEHVKEYLGARPVAVMPGNKVLEVRPAGYDKGKALVKLMGTLGPQEFVLAVGDDRTDEDMFAALPPDAVTIKVGPASAETHARWRVASTGAVYALLRHLLTARGG